MSFSAHILPWVRRLTLAGRYWWRRKHSHEAAALAFYSLFSLIPILLIGLYVASLIVDAKVAQQSLLATTDKMTGINVSDYLNQILENDIHWAGSSVSPILGALTLAFSATKVMSELRGALSKIFGNPRYKKKRQAAISNLLGRLSSLLVIITLGLAIASAVIYDTVISIIRQHLTGHNYLIQLFSLVSPLVTITAVTAFMTIIMRWLPRQPPKLKEALLGGLVSSLLIVALKYGLTLFLKHASISSVFGGALTLVLLLLWIYLLMQVILYAAEFSAIMARERRQKTTQAGQASSSP